MASRYERLATLMSRIGLLSLCLAQCSCVTYKTITMMGRIDGTVDGVNRAFETKDDLIIEFNAMLYETSGPPPLLWTRIGKNSPFLSSNYDINSLRLSRGPIPQKVISDSRRIDTEEVKRRIHFPGSRDYTRNLPWRYPLLPVAVPLSVATDVALTPVYITILTVCAASVKHCPLAPDGHP